MSTVCERRFTSSRNLESVIMCRTGLSDWENEGGVAELPKFELDERRTERNWRAVSAPVPEKHLEFRLAAPVVVLYQRLYNGMPGRFAGLRADPNWADIEEQDGTVRAHPSLWLRRPEDVRELNGQPSFR